MEHLTYGDGVMAPLRRSETRNNVQDKGTGAVEYLRKLTAVQLAKKYIVF
jgi:hypothetical protein